MKKYIALLLALVMTFAMFACSKKEAAASDLKYVKEKGTLVVGASVAFPPYEFYWTNPETGVEEPAGFDMSLAKGIADELGVELVIADQSFAGLITALRAGEIDMIISGMAIREDRLEVVDFTMPYYTGAQIMLVRSEDFDTLKTVEDMTGKKVGAQLGGLQVGILEEQFANAEPYVMEKVPLMILDLLQGQLALDSCLRQGRDRVQVHAEGVCRQHRLRGVRGQGPGLRVGEGDAGFPGGHGQAHLLHQPDVQDAQHRHDAGEEDHRDQQHGDQAAPALGRLRAPGAVFPAVLGVVDIVVHKLSSV
jgi:polar amino acid transport system substrate-binding protein